VEVNNRRRVRWGRVVILFVEAIVLTFLGRFLQDQLSSMVPNHEAILRKGVGAIYVVLLVVFIATPLLEEFGVKVDRSRSKRTK
jgi:membrane protease YdiL (CAAX protease family)